MRALLSLNIGLPVVNYFWSASPVPKNKVTGWTHVKRKVEASHRCKALGSKQYIKVVVVAHARCYIMRITFGYWLLIG